MAAVCLTSLAEVVADDGVDVMQAQMAMPNSRVSASVGDSMVKVGAPLSFKVMS